MKKLIALLLAAVMTLALVACGDKSDDQSSNDGQSGGKKTVVKISMTEGLNSSTYKRAVEFGEKVNAACGDAFDFQIYPSDQLGSYHDVTMEAIDGSVEMIIGGLSTNLDPRGSLPTPRIFAPLSIPSIITMARAATSMTSWPTLLTVWA